MTYTHALQLTESKKHVTVEEVLLTDQKYLMLFSLEGLFIYSKNALLKQFLPFHQSCWVQSHRQCGSR